MSNFYFLASCKGVKVSKLKHVYHIQVLHLPTIKVIAKSQQTKKRKKKKEKKKRRDCYILKIKAANWGLEIWCWNGIIFLKPSVIGISFLIKVIISYYKRWWFLHFYTYALFSQDIFYLFFLFMSNSFAFVIIFGFFFWVCGC